ncbi:FkbM family methyltransferase [Pyxidicoccus trucidator]|uniref:FkbM family methyltransferase n=1 Tax=Pyxidicoccus trucidator TaxID=2709662 RepID=UPI0013DAAE76|nr:FkbM family methyltransferase [Pyxidicoccus trucidator]
MMRLRDLLTPLSRLRYLAWRALPLGRRLTVRLRSGERLMLRPLPATDLDTAFELFVAEVYRPPFPVEPDATRRIVDVGANCGHSLIFWGRQYPRSHVVAFEPHPTHLDLLERNVALNALSGRLTLHRAAAGVSAGEVQFLDAENRSSIVDAASGPTLRVPLVDFFDTVGPEPIDLLKMDIEGGEYPLLKDPRFARLQVRTLVMEWHRTSEHPDGKAWCERALAEMGYEVRAGIWTGEENGLLWARRQEAHG